MLKNLVADARRFLPASPGASKLETARSLIRGILSPGFQALVVYRCFRWAYVNGIPTQPARFVIERFIEIATGISIPAAAEIGPGLRIHHFGGIILHSAVRMGCNCTLYQGVTIGTDGISEAAPVLGNNVMVGAGAKILGKIALGDGCKVGANAVVVHSFPDNAVLVGIPARIVCQGNSRS
jgi:serine O-acetyltransferase